MDLAHDISAWTPLEPGYSTPGLWIVSEVQSTELRAEDQHRALVSEVVARLVDRVFRPALAHVSDEARQRAMLASLRRFHDIVRGAAELLRNGSEPNDARHAQSVVRLFEVCYGNDVARLVERSFRFAAKREAILERNCERRVLLFSHQAAGVSIAASAAFWWSIMVLLLGSSKEAPLHDDLQQAGRLDFVVDILKFVGEQQYVLLRRAENSLRDELDDPPVEAGEIEPLAAEFESSANAAWLEVRRELASNE